MTGEITLRGNVLPIGGLKEKALAAHRGGIHKILLPKENENDIEEIPATVRGDLEFVPVGHVDQVLFEALVCAGAKDFERLLDQKTLRDEKFFVDVSSGSSSGDDSDSEEKEKPSDAAVVTH